ncbi:hypothetical protein Hanom_Chr02g00156131 [Helianthus anomalus]
MTNISVFYDDHHVVFYIHISTMLCLKFLWNVRVWILLFSDLHTVICGFGVCFMVEIVVFYDFVHFIGKLDFVHFIGKLDFVAKPHPNL